MPFVFKRLALLIEYIRGVRCRQGDAFQSRARCQLREPPEQRTDYHRCRSIVTLEKVKLAFGKVNPNQFGVLPVLVVIQNDGDKAIRLDRLKVSTSAPTTATWRRRLPRMFAI